MNRGTVIVYHSLGDCSPENDPYRMFTPPAKFARQMAFLARRRRVLPLADIVKDRHGQGRAARDRSLRAVETSRSLQPRGGGIPLSRRHHAGHAMSLRLIAATRRLGSDPMRVSGPFGRACGRALAPNLRT